MPLSKNAAHGRLVGSGFGNLLPARARSSPPKTPLPPEAGKPVKIALAGAAVLHQPGLLQLREVRGDGALAHHQNLLQFGDGEFLSAQKQQNAQPVGVGQDAENFYY